MNDHCGLSIYRTFSFTIDDWEVNRNNEKSNSNDYPRTSGYTTKLFSRSMIKMAELERKNAAMGRNWERVVTIFVNTTHRKLARVRTTACTRVYVCVKAAVLCGPVLLWR